MIPTGALLHATVLVGVGLSGAAVAAPAWVGAGGTDTGACPVTAPCATFQYAIGQTPAGGTVFVASSGSFGPMTITKAISIIAPPGVEALVYLFPTQARNGVEVNPGSGNVVLLKGITVVANNANAGFFADIEVDSGRVTIEDSKLTTGNWGIYATNPDFLLIKDNQVEGTQRGIENHTNVATIYIGGNTVSDNSYALVGNFNSYGNNTMNGNSLCDVCEATLKAVAFDQ